MSNIHVGNVARSTWQGGCQPVELSSLCPKFIELCTDITEQEIEVVSIRSSSRVFGISRILPINVDAYWEITTNERENIKMR